MWAKTSGLTRSVAKWKARIVADKAKRVVEATARAVWDALRWQVYQRDHGRCRACGCRTRFTGRGNPETQAHCHHVIFRSAQGPDALWNLANTCGACHAQLHEGYKGIRMDCEGDANTALSFRAYTLETNEFREEWRSVAA